MKARMAPAPVASVGLGAPGGAKCGMVAMMGDEDHDEARDEGGFRSGREREPGGLELVADGEKDSDECAEFEILGGEFFEG